MFRRSLYAVILVATLSAIYLKGSTYFHEVLLGLAGTSAGILDLGYLLAMVVVAVIAIRVLLRSRSSYRTPGPGTGEPSTTYPFRAISVQGIRTTIRGAFSTSPVLAGLLALILLAIPISLAALSVGGLEKLSLANWIIVGLAEFPIIIVAWIALYKVTPPR